MCQWDFNVFQYSAVIGTPLYKLDTIFIIAPMSIQCCKISGSHGHPIG